MHLLGELADATWLRLEDLLKDLDEPDKERQAFIDDTRQFFEQRLSTYRDKRKELENSIEKLNEQMYQLFDKLQLPRTKYDNNQMTLIEKRKTINEKIDELTNMVLERDRKLIQLRQIVYIKAKLTENMHINIDEISSTNEAYSILSDLTSKLKKLKGDIQVLLDKIYSLNPDITLNNSTAAKSFLSLNDENELSWLNDNNPLTGRSLYTELLHDYEHLQEKLLTEVVHLRTELGQKEPLLSCDLKEELVNLRLRKRYLSLLSNFPHNLTPNSSLDEIRQTYEQLTASSRAQAREKLKRLWDQLDVPNDQRITPKTADNEDDYLSMNDEIHRLETYVESIRPLLTKIQKREWYKREMIEFEKHAADPARLRGSSTQLLKEERFRKELSREFPKLTDDLRFMVAEWEESIGKKIIYGGESYLETMNKEKLSVDFELLHLRLLTKCQVLVQGKSDQKISTENNNQSTSSTILSHHLTSVLPSPISPLPPSISPLPQSISPLPPSPINKSSTSRIPTINSATTNRKLHKQT
ncbi:unnamed protein product [Rotaria socialis]|uniref:Uncharacterized protein n=1 Tax=Rotaria socialis TaxID=392032 RepID=A0A817WJN0_9BILA|nr:unnamed protein product [Rotaria socialis]CAF3463745.1 unnamed protein product [Rotaria socialis]CAF3727895.1 unnamed protein product [Rotaria socialis]CAF4096865.1 unnamed protein product [Rotaria socialis]CAF4276887.1 unnamed protein product [Rotaria socialis]